MLALPGVGLWNCIFLAVVGVVIAHVDMLSLSISSVLNSRGGCSRFTAWLEARGEASQKLSGVAVKPARAVMLRYLVRTNMHTEL